MDTIFKFLNVRSPYQISDQNRQDYFVSNSRIENSYILKSIKAFDEKERYTEALKIAKKFITDNYKILEDLPEFSKIVYNHFDFQNDDLIEDYKEHFYNAISDLKLDILTDKKVDTIWDLFYAMTLIPSLYPQKRERLYDCIRFLHFKERINKGQKLLWIDFKNIRVIVPTDIFSRPEFKTNNYKKYKEFREKSKSDLIAVYNEVQLMKNAISEIKKTDREFNLNQSKKRIEPIVSVKTEKKGLFSFKEKKQISTVTYEIPEPQNWLHLEFAKEKLSANTATIIEEFLMVNPENDAFKIAQKLETNIYNLIKSYVYSLTPQIKKIVSTESEFSELLKNVTIPAKYYSTSSTAGNVALPDEMPVTLDSAWARGIRPVGIGELKIVRQTFKEYRTGEIAHIENVLASEIRERKNIVELQTEETIIIESEQLEEQQKDLQTTERFELQKESANTINNELKVNTGFSVSGSYGPVKAEAHGDFALSMSSSQSEKTASDFAKEVIDRSMSKIMTRARDERTKKQLKNLRKQISILLTTQVMEVPI